MKKIFIIILSFTIFCLSGCNKNIDGNIEPIENEIQTGDNQGISTNENIISPCEEIELVPFDELEIINIDDIVQNCTFEEGKISYANIGGIGIYYDPYFLNKNGIFTLVDWVLDYENIGKGYSCTLSGGELAFETQNIDEDFKSFLNKYKIPKKGIFNVVFNKNYTNYPQFYHCSTEDICNQLEGKNRGEFQNNYFIYGTRLNLDILEKYILINDIPYYAGKIGYIYENDNEKGSNYIDLIKEGTWNITNFLDNKIIVKKFTQGELYEPYKSNSDLLYGLEYQSKIGTFKIETCEIKV